MARGTWKITTVVAAAAGLLGLAGLALAQTPQWHGTGSYDAQAPLQYRLTQEQARKLDEIQAKYGEKLGPLEKELASKQVELDAAWSRGAMAPEQLTRLRQEVRNLGGQIEDLQAEANAAAFQLLTPVQRPYYGNSLDIFGASPGWSCPWDQYWRGGPAAGRSSGMGWQGTGYSGMRCGGCW